MYVNDVAKSLKIILQRRGFAVGVAIISIRKRAQNMAILFAQFVDLNLNKREKVICFVVSHVELNQRRRKLTVFVSAVVRLSKEYNQKLTEMYIIIVLWSVKERLCIGATKTLKN